MSLKNIAKGLLIGAISGGILGSLVGLWDRTEAINNFKSQSFYNMFIIGATIGAFIGGGISHLMRFTPQTAKKPLDNSGEQVLEDINQRATLQLHEEFLDISKEKIQTGEVKVHKEVFREEKSFTVPVTREELVIETKLTDPEHPKLNDLDVIRIPLSEEEIEILRRPIILNEVEIHKNEYQEVKTIDETLKKEKLNVETTGDTIVINKEIK